jgi:hypothetical protein
MDMNLRKTLATAVFTTLFAGMVANGQQLKPETFPALSQDASKLIVSTQVQPPSNEESTVRIGQRVPLQTSQAYPFFVTPTGTSVQAQIEKQEDETNLDTQLYMLIATNQEIDDARLPTALDPVVKQLRGSLPFKNYRLAATLINRVKNGGRLNLKWIGGPLFASASTISGGTPSFNEFSVNSVKLVRDGAGHEFIRMDQFRFGARVPIQTSQTVASTGAGFPVINYEPTGLGTDISIREGEPAIVGTLNVGPSGDAIILVMTARRTMK